MNGTRDFIRIIFHMIIGVLLTIWIEILMMWLSWNFSNIGLNRPAVRVVTAGVIAVILVCVFPIFFLWITHRDRLIFSYDRECKRLLRRWRIVGVALWLTLALLHYS